MRLRKACLEDIGEISRIHALSWKKAYKGIVPQAYLDELREDLWVPAFNTWIKNGVLTAQLISVEDKPVGSIAYGKSRDKSRPEWGEIVSLYLLPEYFGRGYGNELLKAALLDLRQSGYQNIYLWVLKENQRARHFYEKNQWQCNGDECVCKVSGKELIDIRYVFSYNDI
jgi:ribosomal protein S18 acetylase RimI-like enzyme